MVYILHIKGRDYQVRFSKQALFICCLQERHFKHKETDTKYKRWG